VPTYGYRCDNHHEFEVWQPISDAPLKLCPQCQAPLHRVFYPVGIVFKGRGFYKTDSRGTSPDGAAPAPSKAAKDEGTGSGPADTPKPPDKPAEKKSA
jgi:putative FmdB family regulatory protein